MIVHSQERVEEFKLRLLSWYDEHGRSLPWRNKNATHDAYQVWLSEIMLQQTTAQHVMPYFEKFLQLWPSVKDLAKASDAELMAQWAGLGYYARARNLIKCARVVVCEYAGVFPQTEAALLTLPGIGVYTAAAIMAFAHNQPSNVVDGNVERIMARLYAVETPLPHAKPQLRDLSAHWVSSLRPSDWPQALMDLSALICRPKTPLCGQCPLRDICEGHICETHICETHGQGKADTYPVRAAKIAKPKRYGIVFLIVCGDQFIVEQRPNKGLLGAMLGLPHLEWRGEPWGEDEARKRLIIDAPFEVIGGYKHVFTHFELNQEVWRLTLDERQFAQVLRGNNAWQAISLAQQKSLPTAFAKALKLHATIQTA